MAKSRKVNPPRGLTRILFRFPILLYRAGLGKLLGKRFLLLTHTGRKSGLARQNVLEVIRYDPEQDCYVVISAYGKKADWYQNILTQPEVVLQTGRRKVNALAQPRSGAETLEEFIDYNQRHPGLIFSFATMVGYRVQQTDKGLKELSHHMRAVYLQPIQTDNEYAQHDPAAVKEAE